MFLDIHIATKITLIEMDDYSFKFRDIRVEKANAISKYRRIKQISTFFRLMELLLVLIILSRFSTQLATFNLKFPSEYFERISMTLISPKFVFLIGNAIVVVLILKSYSKNGDKNPDFYEEYVEKCRNNNLQEKNTSLDAYRNDILPCHDHQKKIKRSQSDKNMVRTLHVVNDLQGNGGKVLRRTTTENCKKSKLEMSESSMNKEDGMSNEEFRRTVEAFIARQQRFLREE